MEKAKLLRYGGIVAGVILIAFGIGAIGLSINGGKTVRDNLKAEQITFGDASKDKTVPGKYSNQLVDNGAKARAFAQMMREHTLTASGGFTYSQMGRYQAKADAPKAELAVGGGTNNAMYAALDPATGQPKANGLRELWVTETALSTALNTAYMAENLALFGLVVGIALLLAGIGFIVLAWYALGALRKEALAGEATGSAPAMKPATGH
jgi:hypothetical protein